MAIKHIPRNEYRMEQERILKRYEDAGLTPVDCMTDITNGKGEVCYADGMADGVMAGSIGLFIVGLFWKWVAKKEATTHANRVNRHLAYAMSVKPLTDYKIPGSEDDDREENND